LQKLPRLPKSLFQTFKAHKVHQGLQVQLVLQVQLALQVLQDPQV
jgi:hypothetical protein